MKFCYIQAEDLLGWDKSERKVMSSIESITTYVVSPQPVSSIEPKTDDNMLLLFTLTFILLHAHPFSKAITVSLSLFSVWGKILDAYGRIYVFNQCEL